LGAVLLLISSKYFDDENRTSSEKAVKAASDEIAEIMIDSPADWKEAAEEKINEYSMNTNSDMFILSSSGEVILTSPLSDELRGISDKTFDSDFLNEYKQDPTCIYTDLSGVLTTDAMTVGQTFSANGPSYCIISVPSITRQNTFVKDIMVIFIISAFIVLIISTVIIYFSTLRMIAPIKEMSSAAKKIGRGDFDIQMPEFAEREFNDLANAFKEMAASLKSYDTMRNSFIANVSHELRTPMTSIGGFVDGMLDNTIPPEEQSHYLKIISSEVHRLTRLVRSMLNLAKIEAGELKPNFTSFSVLDPIVDTLVTFEKRLEEKQIDVRGLDTENIYRLWADNDLIHQVIYNLLENAIKFVDKGGYIEFKFEEVGYITVIYIRNSGDGLSQEELSLVFDRFYKTDKSRGMDANGVGLGLNIVRSIIKLHGGKIQVRSVQGEYTEFVFSLPNKDVT
jgi:signal transduction histidine kinase